MATRVRLHSGETRSVLVSVERLELEGEAGLLTVMHDVTQQQRSAEALYEAALFPEENPSPILRVDGEGILLYANRASGPLLAFYGVTVSGSAPTVLANA